MAIIKKGWGHDIAALSNMAEAITNLSVSNPNNIHEYSYLLHEIVERALHKKVSPYKKGINEIQNLGEYGYYLEHLNIILGGYKKVSGDDRYKDIISFTLDNHCTPLLLLLLLSVVISSLSKSSDTLKLKLL